VPLLKRAILLATCFASILAAQTLERTRNPHGPLPVSCEACHTASAWKPIRQHAEFDHNHQTVYPLKGMHAEVACQACHLNAVFKRTSQQCGVCHADLHRAQMGANCEQCHTVRGWTPAARVSSREHSNRFPLLGAHAVTQCESCHTGAANGVYVGLSTDCVVCHRNDFVNTQSPPHAAGNFPQNCTLCHSSFVNWFNAKFDHAAIAHFALTGAHASLPCTSCHIGGRFAGTPASCIGCHQSDLQSATNPNHIQGGFPTDCAQCHSTSSWANATFDHNALSGFPLTGAHASVTCTQCHTSSNFALAPRVCNGCHMTDYNQTTNPNHVAAAFPVDCSQCHSTLNWTSATFDHSKTPFPLTGAHIATPCAQCHLNNNYTNVATNCDACHLQTYKQTTNPNHTSAGFPLNCAVCHSTTNWTSATFNHSTTAFPLTGAHVSVPCASCHVGNNYTTVPTDCYSCHKSDFTGVQNPNHVAAGFPTTCTACHNTTTWANATFDHNALSGFPLTGAHASAACTQCHTSSNFALAPRVCNGCHMTDYNGTTNPNHVAASFPVDCSLCHSTINWSGASFDHSKTPFPLTGTHISTPCAQCHLNNNYTNLATNCDACHLTSYQQTTNPNHTSAGFPLNCALCHSTTNWTGATFNHATTAFPLTGAHVTVPCASCHVGNNYTTVPTDCYSCHKTDYTGVQNPNHVAALFPTTCTTCHNTTSWAGATFNHTWFPIYTGNHARVWTSCADCHLDSSNYVSFSCTACHTHNQASTDPEHRNVRGYVYAPTTCYQCHPSGRAG